MYTLMLTLLIIISILLAISIFIQQGKGDLGLGSLHSGSQMLFGGSGGQEIFEKATWILGALFMMGCLSLSIIKSRMAQSSLLASYKKAMPAKIPSSKEIDNEDEPAAPLSEDTDLPS